MTKKKVRDRATQNSRDGRGHRGARSKTVASPRASGAQGLKWFEFGQNNSGGSFVVTSELCHRVWIQAPNDVAALAKALDLGVYLHGVRDGIDCGCCGDRWHEPYRPTEFPMDYGSGLTFSGPEEYAQYLADKYGWTAPDARLYYADGRVTEIYRRETR